MNYLEKAIKKNSLNLELHSNGAQFSWHKHSLTITPLFCSYGQIGYSIYDNDTNKEYNWDYELNKFEEI